MKEKPSSYEEALRRIYASLLGKLIGIRLGAPIESWTGPQVRKAFAPLNHYPLAYGQFGADDDANGPLFFSRFLLDHTLEEASARAMGNHLLDVVAEERGFFWWGGEEIATEHRAWANLKRGIEAPRSGSEEENGKTLAEQIGGQIFSDCWGWLSLGHVQEAAELARRMSSVTHDGEGIEGGKFVAGCVAAAWQADSVEEMIHMAQKVLNPASRYAHLVHQVEDFYHTHPDDPEACLAWLEQAHSYAHYPGTVHILPNAAILVYGLLYGQGDFNETMRRIGEAGCDTDCNLGNAGAMIGMLKGLEGIEEKWIRPFQDVVLSSSAIGSLNIRAISDWARELTASAFHLHHLAVSSAPRFSLPYAVEGFGAESGPGHAGAVRIVSGVMRLVVTELDPGQTLSFFRRTYFGPEDVYDSRYQPQFAGLLEPGDSVIFTLAPDQKLPFQIRPYIEDAQGTRTYGTLAGNTAVVEGHHSSLPYRCAGLEVQSEERVMGAVIDLADVRLEKRPDYTLRFASLKAEDRGASFGSAPWRTIAGLCVHQGEAQLDEQGLVLSSGGGVNWSGPAVLVQQFAVRAQRLTEDTILEICYVWKGCKTWRALEWRADGLDLVFQSSGQQERKVLYAGNLPEDGKIIIDVEQQCVILQDEEQEKKFSVPLPAEAGCVGIAAVKGKSRLLTAHLKGKGI